MKKQVLIISLILLIIMSGCSLSVNADTEKVTTTTIVQTTKVKKFKKFYMYVNKNKTVVHSNADKQYEIVKNVYKGTKVKVHMIEGKWYKIGKNKWIHKNHLSKKNPMGKYNGYQLQYKNIYVVTSSENRLTRSKGRVSYNGHRETWYPQSVLPGTGLRIPGRHVASDGTIRDEDGYICVAADPSYKEYGSRLMTSLGPAKVYDSGCAYGIIDIYVDW